MFYFKKLGLAFDIKKHNNDFVQQFSQTPNTFDFGNYIRLYFTTRLKSDENGRLKSLIGFADYDKSNLTQPINISKEPVLKLGDVGNFDEFGTYLFTPIRYNNKIIAYYVGFTCTESVPINSSIGIAESTDNGKTFRKIGIGPVLSHSLHEPFLISSHKIRIYNDKLYLFYIAGYKWLICDTNKEPIYKIRMAISDDGIHWNKLNKNIVPNKLGELEAQACPDVFYKNNKYHMFFCYRQPIDYRKNPKNSYRIGYAYSNDLINWTRNDELVGLDISDKQNDFDSEMLAYPHIVEINNEIYMYYVGNEVGRYGIGLAKLEGDLF